MVESLFDLARYDAGALSPQLADVDLAALLGDVQQAASPSARAGELSLHLEAEPVTIRADATKLRQAIDNVVGNAVKFTPTGGAVHLSCAVVGGGVEITVADTGIGIPPDDLPHLFSRFYRASNARTTQTPGTGLGLALSRSIVEAHGGTVSIAPNAPDRDGHHPALACLTEPGQPGTCVLFRLSTRSVAAVRVFARYRYEVMPTSPAC